MRAFGLLRGAQTTADGLWQASRLLGPPPPAKSTSASGGPYRRSGAGWPYRRSGAGWPYRQSGGAHPYARTVRSDTGSSRRLLVLSGPEVFAIMKREQGWKAVGVDARAPAGLAQRSDSSRCLLVQRVGQAPGYAGVDVDAWTHGGRDGHLLEVLALGSGWLEPDDFLQRRGVVLNECPLSEGRLADDKVQVAVLVDAELDLAALDVGDGLADVHRHGAGLWVRHQAARAEDTAETADLTHQVGRGDDRVEIKETALDTLDQLVRANEVSASSACFLSTLAGRENQNASGLACAVRQVDCAANHLVGPARVDAQAERDLDRGVELGGRSSPGQGDCLARCVEPVGVYALVGLAVGLTALHVCSPESVWRLWSAGQRLALPRAAPDGAAGLVLQSALDLDPHRAGCPSDNLLGGLNRIGVQVRHLGLGNLPDLRHGHGPDLVLMRLTAALLHPSCLLDQLGSRRGLGDEGERPVLVDRDLDRDNVAALAFGSSVVLLDEIHDVDAVRAQRGTDWRSRRGGTRVQLDLDDRSDLLLSRSHLWVLTCTFCVRRVSVVQLR